MNQMISNIRSTDQAAVCVRIAGLSKTFRSKGSQVRVLQDLSLDVREGEMLVLLGPSGCGKTTLLRCIAGLEQADAGSITLGARTVSDARQGIFLAPEKRGVGMVFQNYALWPHMTVERNVEFPLRARGMRDVIGQGRARETLDIVQCGHLADRYPPQLSGGQQQRVSLARALASRPEVMLLDEPLSNLDALLRIDLRAQLRQLHRMLGFTGVYVTHDQVEAMNLATRVVVMRAGGIEQIGAPEDIFRRPANEYVAEFLGLRNRLAVAADGDALRFGSGGLPLGGRVVTPGRYHVRARPTEIQIRPAGSDAGSADAGWVGGGLVLDRLPNGDSTDYVVQFEGQVVFVETRDRSVFDKDALVDLGFSVRSLRLYDEAGALTPCSLLANA